MSNINYNRKLPKRRGSSLLSVPRTRAAKVVLDAKLARLKSEFLRRQEARR